MGMMSGVLVVERRYGLNTRPPPRTPQVTRRFLAAIALSAVLAYAVAPALARVCCETTTSHACCWRTLRDGFFSRRGGNCHNCERSSTICWISAGASPELRGANAPAKAVSNREGVCRVFTPLTILYLAKLITHEALARVMET